MKIAIISSGFLPVVDGVTVTLSNRLKVLSQQGHQVLLLCPDYRPIASIYPDWHEYVGAILPGVRVVSLASEPFMGLEFERNPTRASYRLVLQELDAFQPDIIHVDEPDRLSLSLFNAPGVDFAKQHQIPCVAFFHTNFVDYIEDYFNLPPVAIALAQWGSKRIISRVFNAYDATLVSSRVTSENVTHMGIRNAICDDFLGVDLTRFNVEKRDDRFFEKTYGIPDVDRRVKLIFLGRLTADKGWAFTLDAWSTLATRSEFDLDRVAIIVAGEGDRRSEIETRFRQLGIHARCLGRVPPDAVPDLLINSDIHITASEKETRGLTLLEAFAAGIPVIAPRAGGVVETVQEGWNGFLFTPKDVDDFIQTLHRLIHEPDLRRTMGHRGREWVDSMSWTRAVDRLLAVWQSQIVAISTPLK
ncbi:MAG: glycosyltransferase [Elainellaceae cyanobacterium]